MDESRHVKYLRGEMKGNEKLFYEKEIDRLDSVADVRLWFKVQVDNAVKSSLGDERMKEYTEPQKKRSRTG